MLKEIYMNWRKTNLNSKWEQESQVERDKNDQSLREEEFEARVWVH